jgi:hypothetical protein
MNQQLRAEYGESIEIRTAEEVIAGIAAGNWRPGDGERRRAQAI